MNRHPAKEGTHMNRARIAMFGAAATLSLALAVAGAAYPMEPHDNPVSGTANVAGDVAVGASNVASDAAVGAGNVAGEVAGPIPRKAGEVAGSAAEAAGNIAKKTLDFTAKVLDSIF